MIWKKGLFVFYSLVFVVLLFLYFARNHFKYSSEVGVIIGTIQQLVVNPLFPAEPSFKQSKQEYVYPSLPVKDTGQQLIQLHWTSLGGTSQDTSFHFFSAYYDGRASKDLDRPAVFVIGYVNRKAPSMKFYCLFRYANRSVCREKNAIERHVSPCFVPQLAARPYHYLCKMAPTEEVPLAVHFEHI